MTFDEAEELIRPAITAIGGTWADFGAGDGLFTRALARLVGPSGTIHAVDHDPRAVRTLQAASFETDGTSAEIIVSQGDFSKLDGLSELEGVTLDGVVFANALHFSPDPERVLAVVAGILKVPGRIVVVEYDRTNANRWVPYPVPFDRLRAVAAQLRLERPRIVNRRPSAFGGVMYCAVLTT